MLTHTQRARCHSWQSHSPSYRRRSLLFSNQVASPANTQGTNIDQAAQWALLYLSWAANCLLLLLHSSGLWEAGGEASLCSVSFFTEKTEQSGHDRKAFLLLNASPLGLLDLSAQVEMLLVLGLFLQIPSARRRWQLARPFKFLFDCLEHVFQWTVCCRHRILWIAFLLHFVFLASNNIWFCLKLSSHLELSAYPV